MKAYHRVLRLGKPNWNRVIGPIGALIATLAGYGWDSISPELWTHPTQGDIRPLQLTVPDLLRTVSHTVNAALWTGAAQHYCGTGLRTDGPAPESAHLSQKLHRTDPVAAGALDCVFTGGYWPAARRATLLDVPADCYRCGHPHCDPLHTFWLCPYNAQVLEGTTAEHTDVHTIAAQDPELSCLWLRGILPMHLVTPTHPIPTELNVTHVGQVPTHWPSGTYYTDGSGGKWSSYATMRRCGFGIAFCQPHFPLGESRPRPS